MGVFVDAAIQLKLLSTHPSMHWLNENMNESKTMSESFCLFVTFRFLNEVIQVKLIFIAAIIQKTAHIFDRTRSFGLH